MMKKPKRGGLPRYAIRLAVIEIRAQVAARMHIWPLAPAYICHACDRVLRTPHRNPTTRAAVAYIKSYVLYKLDRYPALECWQSENGRWQAGTRNANDARIAWLTWMLEGIEREIEEKGSI